MKYNTNNDDDNDCKKSLITTRSIESDAATPFVSKLLEIVNDKEEGGGAYRTIDEFYEEAHDYDNDDRNNTTTTIESSGLLVSFFRIVTTTISRWSLLLQRRLSYYMIFVSLGIANIGDSAEIGSMGFLLANDDFRNDVVPPGYDGLVASALYYGMFIGGLCSGSTCDHYGRRRVMLVGLVITTMAGMTLSFTTTLWELVGCRLVMGVGIGTILTCLLALTSEHTPPLCRGLYLNFVSGFWTVGAIWVAVLANGMFNTSRDNTKSWRLYCFVNALPSMMAIGCIYCFVPESARFLGLRGRYDQAANVANQIVKSMNNGATFKRLRPEEVQSQFSSSCATSTTTTTKTTCAGFVSMYTSLYTTSYNLRQRILIVQGLWFITSFGTGMSLWVPRYLSQLLVSSNDDADSDNTSNVYLFSLYYNMATVPGIVVAGFVLDRMKRTTLLLVGYICTTLVLAVLTFLTATYESTTSSNNTTIMYMIVITVCMFNSCLSVIWTTLSIITAETFSTSIRSTAMGICSASGRLAFIIVHNIAAYIMQQQHFMSSPLALVGMTTISFFVGFVFLMRSNLESRTGAPLHDIEK